MKKLNKSQKAFCKNKALGLSNEESAIKAGYSKTTAKTKSHTWLGKSEIKAEIARLEKKVEQVAAEEFKITAAEILNELAKIGFSNVKDFYNSDGSLKQIQELDDKTTSCISSIKVQEVKDLAGMVDGVLCNIPAQTKEIKLWDKRAALVDLGKHLKLFTDKVENETTFKNSPFKIEIVE